jgi:hypothetical protein
MTYKENLLDIDIPFRWIPQDQVLQVRIPVNSVWHGGFHYMHSGALPVTALLRCNEIELEIFVLTDAEGDDLLGNPELVAQVDQTILAVLSIRQDQI